MTLPSTYSTLVSAIQEELEDSGQEFVAFIPTAINQAERRINRDVDGLYNQYITTINANAGTNTLTKPSRNETFLFCKYCNR